jgi:peptidyl-prolyl cis-trans isomerase A (cyclophilin A)
MKINKKLTMASVALLAVFTLVACGSKKTEDTTSSSKATTTSSAPAKPTSEELNKLDLPQLDPGVAADEDLVELQTTDGNIEIKLFPKQAPLAVANFLGHAKEGYYNGTIFHRIIKGFMIQGGDPEGTGAGGQSIWKGKDGAKDSGNGFKNEISDQLYNLNGALSMANAGPDTNGSQFFINQNTSDQSDGLLSDDYPQKIIDAYAQGGNPTLDGGYTVFGQVTKGMDVVVKIADEKVEANGTEMSKPVNPVKIVRVKILQEAK